GVPLLLWLPGCSTVQGFFALIDPPSAPSSHMRQSVLDRLATTVRKDFEQLTGSRHRDLLVAHETVEGIPAQFKRRVAVKALKQPWDGLTDLEHQGLLLAEMARGGTINLPALLDVLEAGMDRTSTLYKPIPLPTSSAHEELLAFMVGSLEQASLHREKALTNLTEAEKHFLFLHAGSVAEYFIPQISSLSDQTSVRVKADLLFAKLLEEQVGYDSLIAAAQVLARLANEHWLHQVAGAWTTPLPTSAIPPGVTGDVLLVQETSYGLIVIGGPGPNTYELDKYIGLIIDVGGKDLYRGMIASSANEDQGNAVVIDLNGDDTYAGAPLGLATGRLGVGLLIDHDGNDIYQLDMGSGGAGFGGLGILYDAKGNDIYLGNRLTQGAAIGGLGLLLDGAGNDRYTSHGFAIGFGGPLGVGAIIDIAGDDDYRCGDTYPSTYNPQDAPTGKSGDLLYQYDCFGLGAGSGQRILTKKVEWQAYSLAGGLGVLLDIEGRDHYNSANFSQGQGYFFGAGIKLDLDGDDEHHGARYGHGAAAHFGVGLFIDRQGDDRYGSFGPFYNGGVAWDNSVSLMIDAGKGRDIYDFDRSTGLGRADYSGWGLFIDEGGADQYQATSGFGDSSEKSVAGFFDLEGKDTYTLPSTSSTPTDARPTNGRLFFYPQGGAFVDR
ncbi:MAG TPA: hypothetical protein VK901_17665, partial [Nitrospiraceae bacterium]|nr:hypothetical protein [Nitrospiraceae bacterium]